MNESVVITWDDEYLYIQPGPVAAPPVVDVYALLVIEGGELPSGIYYYAVTSVGENGESAPYNILKVRAPYKEGNTISINWFSIDHIIEYKIYRGISEQEFDGFIPFYGKNGSSLTFIDTGDIGLHDSGHNPPHVTPLASPAYSIKREDLIKLDWTFYTLEDESTAPTLHVSTRHKVVHINLWSVLNQPSWNPNSAKGVRKASTDLEKWFNDGRIKKKIS